MSSATNYLENKLIDWILRGQAFTPPATVYLALFTSDPGETGSLASEVAGGSYARASMTSALATWSGTQGQGTTTVSSGTSGTTYNNVAVVFPEPTGSWGTITHVAIMDAATSGNALWVAALAEAKTITAGSGAVIFLPNELSLQIDN